MNWHGKPAPQGDLRDATGKLLHRVSDVKQMLGIGHTTTYRLIGEGKLKVVKIGAATRITDESVRAFVASLGQEAA